MDQANQEAAQIKKKIKVRTWALIIVGVLLLFTTYVGWIRSEIVEDEVKQGVAGVQVQASEIPTPAPTATPEDIKGEQAKLISVTDGDTIKVSINGKTENVRIIGINTPETVDPRKPVECMGAEASRTLKFMFDEETIPDVKDILLESDPTQGDRDKYQRLLRYVWDREGIYDYGKAMIALGYANEYTYDTPYKYQSLYKQVQKEALEAKKGLWADDACDNLAKASVAPKVAIPKQSAAPATNQSAPAANTGGFTCNCSKTCPNMSSCAEAQFQLNSCGCSARDADDDGIACDADCQ